MSEGVSALAQAGWPAAVGVLATLSERLPARERLCALTLRNPEFDDRMPHLAWLLAREVRRAPDLLDAVERLDAATITNLVAGLTRTLPTREAHAIAAQVLDRLTGDTRAEVRVNLTDYQSS